MLHVSIKTTEEIEKQNNMTVRALHSQPDGLSILRRHEIRFSKQQTLALVPSRPVSLFSLFSF